MANIHEYLVWRGDVPFSISPFNEVDGLVLSELAYADFHGVVPESGERVTIEEVRRLFWEKHTKEEIMAQDSYTKTAPFLLDGMAGKGRFAGTEMAHFYDVIDLEKDIQLAAVIFYLPDGTAFAAYRGTDDTVVGWKEDFNLSYMPETEGQRRAAKYLNERFTGQNIPIRVGGHSKGGNLAMYAAVCADAEVRKHIIAVYNNDGPGFLRPFTETEAYRDMLPRIICTVPEKAVIGTLLTSEAYQHVVKSTANGIFQHDGFSWQVLGDRFVEVAKRTDASMALENTLRQWLYEQSEDDRRMFVNTLFGLLESTGRSTIGEIKSDLPGSLASMWKMLETMQKDQRETLWNMIAQFFAAGSDTLLQETRKTLLSRLGNIQLPQLPQLPKRAPEPKPEESV